MKKRIMTVCAIFTIVLAACGYYVSDYYHADKDAITEFQANISVTKQVLSDNTIVYVPEHAETGLIFYPGGKVEYSAYEPLMAALANQNVLTILVEMPFNLAVLDVNAAEGLQENYPEIRHWYMGGHSLGGSMAATYLSENSEDFEGLILLASYSTEDFSDEIINVLSIYGSEDQVLNAEKYNQYKSNLPADATEIILEGGNHAQFGMYGPQDGDGMASISNTEQIEATLNAILQFISTSTPETK